MNPPTDHTDIHAPPADLLAELRLTLILADAEQVVVQRADGLYGALWAIPGQWNALVCPTADEALDPHEAPSVGWHHYLAATTLEEALRALAAWDERGVDLLGALRRQGRTRIPDGWVQVAGPRPAPPIEDVYEASPSGRISRSLYKGLGRGVGTHWFEGKVRAGCRAGDPMATMLAVGVVAPASDWPLPRLPLNFGQPCLTGWAEWCVVEVEVVDEPRVLELPERMLAAMTAYAVEYPGSANSAHWLAPVPAITRIQRAAELAMAAALDEVELVEEPDFGEIMAHVNAEIAIVGAVDEGVSWRATWEAIRARWPALTRKYAPAEHSSLRAALPILGVHP